MKTVKELRTAVLQDTIEYYSQDPEGRRCKDENECCYSPNTIDKETTSDGCAIGRLLSPKLREELDIYYEGVAVSNDDLFNELPQAVQELGQEFLRKLQSLHDVDTNWNSEGLSEYGEEFAQHIERVYCM